jgi:oligopeptide transport system permease protein
MTELGREANAEGRGYPGEGRSAVPVTLGDEATRPTPRPPSTSPVAARGRARSPLAADLSTLDAKTRGLWADAWRRLRRNTAAMTGLGLILGLTVVAVFAPVLAPYPPDAADFAAITQPPSRDHLLGTDSLGQDVLSRLIYGTRVSLTVGFVAQIVIILIGVPIGLVSAYYGGWVDLIVQRIVDVLYAFPSLLFVIVVMTYLKAALAEADGPIGRVVGGLNDASGGLLGVVLALVAVFWLTVSRLVRGEVLALKQREFVEAARGLGAGDGQVMRRHILPNTLAPIVIAVTFGIPAAIMVEAGLSFLGLGVEPPTASWGLMISEGVRNIRSYPHLLLSSGVLLSLTLLAFNFLGDGLRDAIDPWMKP